MIYFSVDYKDLKLAYESEKLEEGIVDIYNVVNHIPYRLLGFNLNSDIDSEILSRSFKINSLYKEMSALEYKPLANSYISEILFKNKFDILASSPKVSNKPLFKSKLVFISDVGWVIIKKKTVSDETNPREVAAFMFSVRASSIAKRAYDSLSEERMKIIEKQAKGKRGLKALDFVYEFDDPWEYAYAGALVGFPITPTNKILKKVFPELKLPGIRGRRAGPTKVL